MSETELKEALKMAVDMEGRARIRRQATDRKSVQEGSNDRLSDQLEQASAMICRLVEELNKQTKPLSDEEIKQIFQEQTGFYFDDNPADDLALMDFARAIEERHGIKK